MESETARVGKRVNPFKEKIGAKCVCSIILASSTIAENVKQMTSALLI